MSKHQELINAAITICEKIHPQTEAARAAADSLEELAVADAAGYDAYKAEYVRLMAWLADSAYAGDAFSKAYIATAFGDLEFDPEGEEFGHERVLPADKAAVMVRVKAIPAKEAKANIQALSQQVAW